MPDISDELKLATFANSWWKWWQNLQPSWRIQQSMALSRQVPPKPNWSITEKGTANGFFVVILALGWWALGIKHGTTENVDGNEDFLNAVGDTTWVLQQMVLSRSLKRPRADDGNGSGNPKRCAVCFSTIIFILI
jgi:hypothetical protein